MVAKYAPISNRSLPKAEILRPYPSNFWVFISTLIILAFVLSILLFSNRIMFGIGTCAAIALVIIIMIPASGVIMARMAPHENISYLRSLYKYSLIGDLIGLKSKNIIQVHDVRSTKIEYIAGNYIPTEFGGGASIESIAWETEGSLFAIGSTDCKVRVYNIPEWKVLTLEGHTGWVMCVAWAPDKHILASASRDKTICLWDVNSGTLLTKLTGHDGFVESVAWSPDGKTLASASNDRTLRLWDTENMREIKTLALQQKATHKVAWSPAGDYLAVSDDNDILLWNTRVWECKALKKHTKAVKSLAWSSDSKILLSGSEDKTIQVWNPHSGRIRRALEGYLTSINMLAFIYNDRLLVSRSEEGVLQFRETHNWQLLISADYREGEFFSSACFAFAPNARQFAMPVVGGHALHIWDVDPEAILSSVPATPPVHYTNAKVVLVGDSGVGKTGLGLTLSGQRFVPTESTHGRHIWTLTSNEVETQAGGREIREILLWDLAGQPGYRVIHQLHLDEVVVALVVFDRVNETDPFSGVRYWCRALQQSRLVRGDTSLPLTRLLVAGRCDRGNLGVSEQRIRELCHETGCHDYFPTSAKRGTNIQELRKVIESAIDWSALPIVESTELFQSIKEFLLGEKLAGRQLDSSGNLYASYQKGQQETNQDYFAEFITCIGLLEAAGLIQRLSFGDLILLQPELLDSYAAGLINTIKDEPDGLGATPIELVYQGHFSVPAEDHIHSEAQERLFLIALIEDLLRRELALKEEHYLIFPSEATRMNPGMPRIGQKSVIFRFQGPLQNIYATLTVRLARSEIFAREDLWQNAITYTASAGGSCGLALEIIDEGVGELALFYNADASEQTRYHFEEYVSAHLKRTALPQSIESRRLFACSSCGRHIPDEVVKIARRSEQTSINCPFCPNRIALLDYKERLQMMPSSLIQQIDHNADISRDRDADLVSVEGKKATNDFDVFLCYNEVDLDAVEHIGLQLKQQGLLPWLDEWEVPPGVLWMERLSEQISMIKTAAVFIGKHDIEPWQKHQIYALLQQFSERNCRIIPVFLAEASKYPKLPVFLKGVRPVDFRNTQLDPIEQLCRGITGK